MAPKRIISLVPSETELLYSLGLDKETIGITKFCVHPDEWFRTKTRIGGTKTIDTEKIKSLKPDLILANKEENVKEQADELAKYFPVHVSDVKTFDDGLELIEKIGAITGKETEASDLQKRIKHTFAALQNPSPKPKAIYLIWQKPYMTIGGDTFISDMMRIAGLENCCKESERYPEINIEEMQQQKPELLLLSSEPFPFKQKHIDELQPLFPETKIILVDGEMFSWYGSRMQEAAPYFAELIEKLMN